MFVALNIHYIKGFISTVHLSGCTCVKGSHLCKSLKKKKEGAKKKKKSIRKKIKSFEMKRYSPTLNSTEYSEERKEKID